MTDRIAVQPGIYPGTPYETYATWDALRVSTLKWAGVSGKHLKWAIDGRLEREETDALRLGTAIHMRLLEPERYEIFMPVADSCSALLKSGARKDQPCGNEASVCDKSGTWYCGQHVPKDRETSKPTEYVTVEEAAMIEELNHEIRLHPVVRLLRQQGGCELSVVAECEGVLMKCRIDKLIEPFGNWPHVVLDIKTKRPFTVGLDKCRNQSAELNYHVQAEVYRRVLRKLKGIEEIAVVHLFVESGAPYDCLVIQSSETDMIAGNNEFLNWIATYKHGMETDEWPGASNEIETGLLPEWKLKQAGVKL